MQPGSSAADLAMFGQGAGVQGGQLALLTQQHGLIGPVTGFQDVAHVSKQGQLVYEAWVGIHPRRLLPHSL